MRIKNESTRNHLEHLSAQEYLSSSLLHSSGFINCGPLGQQQTETLALLSIVPTWRLQVGAFLFTTEPFDKFPEK